MRSLILALLLLVPCFAYGQSNDQLARKRFEAGVSAANQRDYGKAVREFEAAYKLSPRPILLFNIGQAYRLMGNNKKAAWAYRRYLWVEPEGLYAPEAKKWLKEIKRGKPQRRSRRKRVRRRRRKPKEVRKSAADIEAERQRAELEVAMRAAQDDGTMFAGDGSIVGTRRKLSSASQRAAGLGTLGYTGLATVGVGLFMSSTSLYFGLRGRELSNDLEGTMDRWTDGQLEKFERGERYDRTAKVFAGFGISFVALGAVLLVGDLVGDTRAPRPSIDVAPSIEDDGAGLVVTGSF